MKVQFVVKSENKKLGPIPMSIQDSSTCPLSCPYKGSGCYAAYGPLGWNWRKVDAGTRGGGWDAFLEHVKALPEGQLWRYGVAGDLPGTGEKLDAGRLLELVEANRGKRGFTFTHKPLTKKAVAAIRAANQGGFTINLSADGPGDADRKLATGAGPVVTVLPSQTAATCTPNGARIVVCPATYKDVTCKTCALCARPDRRVVIGFPAHGSGKKQVENRLAKSS